MTDVEVAGLDKSTLVGEDHDLGAVPQAKLCENARHVRLHRSRADDELLADLGVAGTACDRGLGIAGAAAALALLVDVSEIAAVVIFALMGFHVAVGWKVFKLSKRGAMRDPS